MIVRRLDARGRREVERAARAGEPLVLAEGVRAEGREMDELVPFFHEVRDPALARWMAPGAREAWTGADPLVTAIIPASRHRPIGLAALAAQDVPVEVLVLANGVFQEGVRVPWEGHGRTRMRGVERARAPYVLFLVDDALPLGAGFVRTLVEALEAGGFDAVTARQVPWPTSDPVTRARLRAWTPPHPLADPPLDHVAALHRRDLLLREPLPDVPTAEDWAWGRGRRLGYAPGAPVAHAHRRRFGELYRRTRDIHRVRIAAGEAPRVPGVGALVRGLPGVVGRDAPGALGELLGQFVAGR